VQGIMRQNLSDGGLRGAKLDFATDRKMTSYLNNMFDEFWGKQ
jgi:hypothetical protein